MGAFLLERRDRQAFPVKALERLSLCVAPLLTLYRKADRQWWAVFKQSLAHRLEQYLGQERPGVRLLCGLAAFVLLCSMLVTARWQIVAPAELLSNDRRLVTAPLAGFVADMQVVAGDQVTKGQLLARLDRRELELEMASKESEVVMADAELRAAMASYDRQTTGIARARLAQARARREGIEQRLNRTDLVSPIDGLVIASDATRTSGTAVSLVKPYLKLHPVRILRSMYWSMKRMFTMWLQGNLACSLYELCQAKACLLSLNQFIRWLRPRAARIDSALRPGWLILKYGYDRGEAAWCVWMRGARVCWVS